MPPSSEKMKYSAMTSGLKSLMKEQDYDVIMGSMTVTQGVLLLLFSHRFNKELPVIITECPQDAEKRVFIEAQEIIRRA